MNVTRALLTLAALSTTASAATYYTVQTGDTLATVAQKVHMEPDALMELNGLSSATVQVGQRLNLTPSGFSKAVSPVAQGAGSLTVVNAPKTNTAATITPSRSGGAFINAAASRYLGIRYLHGGTGGGGIDCSGFTLRVFQSLGINLPRTAAAQWRIGIPVSSRDLRPGDLVFFNTMGRTASHVGIYLGGGMMAGANSYYGRTMVEPLFSNPYWASRYNGARRVLN